MTTATTRRISLPRACGAARRELLTFAVGYLTYFGVRAITDAAPWKAFDNAAALFRLEVDLGIDWEGAVQRLVLQSQTFVDLANVVYIYGHWPILIGSAVLLFRYRRPYYYRLRNVCLLTGFLGLVIFALFPVAPPRLTDLPVIDTITRDSEGYRQILPPELVNQFAAMPSFHAGWNLLVGIVVFEATRHWLLRTFAVLMPAAMAFAVVATANHFVLDVIVGVTIVLIALAIVRAWERRRDRRKLVVDHGRAARDEQSGRRVAVRRRPPCGQPPGPAARGRRAGAAARRG